MCHFVTLFAGKHLLNNYPYQQMYKNKVSKLLMQFNSETGHENMKEPLLILMGVPIAIIKRNVNEIYQNCKNTLL